jgi:hypothetical protein
MVKSIQVKVSFWIKDINLPEHKAAFFVIDCQLYLTLCQT